MPTSTGSATPSRLPIQHTAWRLFLTVHALSTRRIDRDLQAGGCLSFDDYDVLLTLNEAPEETLRMSELAGAVLLSNSGMSRRVTRLSERNLVTRRQSLKDGRVFHVRLTRKGRNALERSWKVYEGLIEEVFARHLTDREAEVTAGLFQRILNRIGDESHRGILEAGLTDAPRESHSGTGDSKA